MIELKEPQLKVKVRDERAVRKALADVQAANPEKLLVASEVVEAGRDEKSPLHSCFTWDETKAAHKCRLMEARAIIRHLVVTMPDDKSEATIPKYVSLRSDRKKPGGGYRDIGRVLASKELLAELEATAKRDIDGVLGRYEMLKELVARVRKAAGIAKKK